MKRKYIFFLCVIPFVIISGCRSIKSRYIGPEGIRGQQELGGIPIMIERPRWLKVAYKQVTYLIVGMEESVSGMGTEDEKVQTKVFDRQVKTVSEIETKIICMGEVYAIDMERPMAGTVEYELQFPKDSYYPTLVKGKVEDKTIEKLRELIDTLAEKAKVFAAPTGKEAEERYELVRLEENIERIEIYDIYDLTKPIVTFKK